MLSPFPRCRPRVLPSSCPGAVDGGGGVGDGFRAVGATEAAARAGGEGVGVWDAVGATEIAARAGGEGVGVWDAVGVTEIAARAGGGGTEEAVFFALSLWLAVCSAISAVVIDLLLALP